MLFIETTEFINYSRPILIPNNLYLNIQKLLQNQHYNNYNIADRKSVLNFQINISYLADVVGGHRFQPQFFQPKCYVQACRLLPSFA